MTLDINTKDEMVMKLLHYFITEKNYNPVVLHGAQEEIWLENMDNDSKIVRIVSNYIHNNEQLDFDLFKTQKIVSNIKKKTLNLNMNVLSNTYTLHLTKQESDLDQFPEFVYKLL